MPRNKRASRIGEEMRRLYPDRFDTDFDHNKSIVKELIEDYTPAIKERANEAAGYITRYKIKEARGTIHGAQPPTPPKKKRKGQPYKRRI